MCMCRWDIVQYNNFTIHSNYESVQESKNTKTYYIISEYFDTSKKMLINITPKNVLIPVWTL